jgi:uncharacterized membrane protein YphA (DoxX/SURF4 family)
VARPHQIPFRAFLWDYLGHPDDESMGRRRILYALVVLRLGFGLVFLLRGWSAIFATPPDAFATRLGDPARLGLSGLAVDTTLFIIGCTELGIGALLLFGAFTRVSAVTGLLLGALSLFLGERRLFSSAEGALMVFRYEWSPDAVAAINVGALISLLCGLAVIAICGAPFMSADRALDKLEEEERDRAPAKLPTIGEAMPLLLRLGLAGPIWWLVLWDYGQTGGRSPLVLVLCLLSSAALLLGLWTRLLPLPFVLFAILGAVDGGGAWRAMEWLLPAIPTVALALIVAGPGRVRVGRWQPRGGHVAA